MWNVKRALYKKLDGFIPLLMFSCLCFQPGSIMSASWPTLERVDEMLTKTAKYLIDAAHDFRIPAKQYLTPKGKVR